MPESKRRKNRGKHTQGSGAESDNHDPKKDSPLADADSLSLDDLEDSGQLPQWYKVTMFALLLIGLLWICLYYIIPGDYPLPVGGWNIIIGFGIAMLGFFMMMRWK